MSEPETKQIRARDVAPFFWAQWCSVGGGEPFANAIVGVRWSEDGKHLWFMLESHNFMKVDPDEMLELVPLTPSKYRRDAPPFVLPPPPTPAPNLQAEVESLRAENTRLREALEGVLALSDRKHVAWDKARAALAPPPASTKGDDHG
jgi:hypothetical protein